MKRRPLHKKRKKENKRRRKMRRREGNRIRRKMGRNNKNDNGTQSLSFPLLRRGKDEELGVIGPCVHESKINMSFN